MNKKLTFEATVICKTETETEKLIRYVATAIGDYETKPKVHKVITQDGDLFNQIEVGRTYQITCTELSPHKFSWVSAKLSSVQPTPKPTADIYDFSPRKQSRKITDSKVAKYMAAHPPRWETNEPDELYAF